ncbi:interleukin-1 receptor-like 1 isoform X3 [Phyllostomus hastatus]|uniref:interleukin-1 receptor-like 1 isoform X3 n=1 Tax=Phyllostomus hastatus TaxID=9423 RepID=UPI001E683BC0|nr:interleukin-1 receptor-like 1 isoform X3 [Phyllostomus hastatus]
MRLWVLAILTVLIHFTVATFNKSSWGLENEALIVMCPRQGKSQNPVVWFYSKTNKSVTTQKESRVFASGERLKLFPAKVEDSGIYTCIIRSPTFIKTGYVNVTIYKKQPDCNIPDDMIYSTTSGSEKNSKIFCPTIDLYNWTAPVEWFKNCKALQGSRYYTHKTYLLIDNATSKDTGDYTCRFMHNENGVSYNVTATRSFTVHEEKSFSLFPVIIAPPQNETKDVEIGKTANIICSACFGKGSQLMSAVQWQVNGSIIGNSGEARIQEEQEQNQSSSNELTCRSTILRIADVREEDLLLKYDCLARNFYGLRRHTIILRRKKPIDRQSTYYILAGFGILLMLINIMMIMLKVFWIEVVLLWRDIARPYKTRNDMATAVETNIRKSRRYIFILTPQIVYGKEFTYEQEIALHRALIQDDSKAILIEMEALSEPGRLQLAGLPDSLQHLVKVQGTIKWREDHVANKRSLNSRFWKHVRYHMPVPNRLPRKTCILASSNAQEQ